YGVIRCLGEGRGMETFRKLSALKPDMRLGHALLAELIAAGEVPVGLTVYSGNADSLKKKGAPIDCMPVEPIVGRPQAASVASRAPHPNAAMLFVDFLPTCAFSTISPWIICVVCSIYRLDHWR